MQLCHGIIAVLCFINASFIGDVSYRQLEPGKAEFKTDKILIRVTLSSSIYTYELTNLQESPITGFKVSQHHSYAFTPPPGWERTSDKDFFYADTNQPDKKIKKGQTAEFSLRVSSRGATLGKSDIEIYCDSGQKIVVPGVWSPASEPKSYPLVVAGTIIAIMLIQTIIIFRRNRGKSINNVSGS